MVKENIENYKANFSKEKGLIGELNSLIYSMETSKSPTEKNMIGSHMEKIEQSLIDLNKSSMEFLRGSGFIKKLESSGVLNPKINDLIKEDLERKQKKQEEEWKELEWITIQRLKRSSKHVEKKVNHFKPNLYVKYANSFFANISSSLIDKGLFRPLEKSLIKSNIQMTTLGYVSVILFTTFLASMFGFFVFCFLLFFNVQATYPFLTGVNETIIMRVMKVFWVLLLVPLLTYFSIYFYPFLEKKSIAHRIEHEMPFATIHMAAISGSMIDPTKIFEIILSTGEYPYLEKEFTKLLNQINIYGYNLAFALRNVAFNSPSLKFAELLNGLATTITSGGDLSQYFEQKSKSLLFEYRLEREKETKTSETFMDIYVSVVIAAPMILMLLVMMIKISGIGIGFSTSVLGLLFVLGVTVINLAFLAFLHIKQSSE